MSKKELPDALKGLEEYYSWKEKAIELWDIINPICAALVNLKILLKYPNRVDFGENKDISISYNRIYFRDLNMNDKQFPFEYKGSEISLTWLGALLEVILPSILRNKKEISEAISKDTEERKIGADNLKFISEEYKDFLAAHLLLKGEDKK